MTLYITKKQKIAQLEEYREKFICLRSKVKYMLTELTNELSEISLTDPSIPKISKGRGRPRKVLPIFGLENQIIN